MTLATEPMTNSLIVTSSEATYLEVRAFVEALDAATLQTQTVTLTVPLTNISPDLAQRSLTGMLGKSVEISTVQSTQSPFGSGGFGGRGLNTFGGGSPFGGMSGMSPFGGGVSPFGGGGFRLPGTTGTFGSGATPSGGGGFRPQGTTGTFGGTSTIGGGNNPFMGIMRSPTGGSTFGAPQGSGTRSSSGFGGGGTTRPQGGFGGR